jgi:hypothetical protein
MNFSKQRGIFDVNIFAKILILQKFPPKNYEEIFIKSKIFVFSKMFLFTNCAAAP